MDALANTQQNVAAVDTGESALATLPPEWVKPVGFFCLANLYLIRTRGPLVANLKLWIKRGLTIDDGMKIMHRLLDPEVAQNFQFENQLMSEFRASVARVLRFRRIQRDAELSRKRTKDEVSERIVGFADHLKMPEAKSKAPPMPRRRDYGDRT